MMQIAKAVLLTACCGMLLAGCGSDHDRATQDEHRAATSVQPAVTAADDHNRLYESDDRHRDTDVTEPDLIDRAETAVSKAGDKARELVTDVKVMLTDAAADLTETAR